MAQIIASVHASGREQAQRDLARAAMASADWVELRLDRWPQDQDLAPVIGSSRLPVLAACRTPEDGGSFRGSLAQRRELLSAALAAGARGLDLEHWETWAPSVGRDRLKLLMRSFHCLTGVPKDLPAIQDKLFSVQGTVAKIAVLAHELADAAPVFDLLGATDQTERPTVAFAMGRQAAPVRVLACVLGSPYVYGSLGPGEETAPGQLPTAELSGLYRCRELSGSTQVFGLLGNPALHSLGPWLHNRAYRRLRADAVYVPLETSRPEAVLAMLPRRQLRGLSVTAPHKQALAAQCHRLSPEAAATSVVNTLVMEAHGLLAGHNTDVLGVDVALREAGAGAVAPGSRTAVVLGTGGAARAGAFALLRLGYAVTMLGRSLDPARTFASHHGIQLGSLQERLMQELDPAVVVHATPVGSAGREPEERLLPGWLPRPGTVVMDMVYRPAMTKLLRDCAAAGARVVPGMAMFLVQAAAQIRLFLGAELPPEELRLLVAGGDVP
jgi:3-dehydroquinate dehydratase/shikimate dehydrogenase